MTDAQLRFLISVDDRDLKEARKEVTRLEKELGSTSKGGSESLAKLGKAATVASVAIVAGLAVGAKIAFDELAEGQKVSAQTEAALKSTGAAAHVTAKGISDLANEVSRKSGIDDETVQSGENMLLTFTKIRNETGKGNDIFNQSTRVLADMSTALGQDMPKSAIQLGKALNDPIKGISALRRVGVSFDDATKEQIKTLVSHGHTLEAQKIILKELNTEFGGSAEALGNTLPGQINKAKNAFANMSADLLSALLPALTGAVGLVADLTSWMSKNEQATKIVIGVVGGLALGVLAVSAAMKLYAAAQTVVTAATWLWNAALAANPIGLVVLALALLGVALFVAWQKSETFRAIVTGAFDAVKAAARAVADFVTEKIPAGFLAAIGWLRLHWPEIAVIVSGPFAPLVALATNAFGIRSALVGAFTAVKDWADAKLDEIVGFFKALPSRVGSAVAGLAGAAGLGPDGPFRAPFRLASEFVGEKIDDIVSFFRGLPGRVAHALGAGAGLLRDAVTDLFHKLPDWAEKILGIKSPSTVFADIGANVVRGFIAGLERMGPELLARAKDLAGSVASTVKGAPGAIAGAVLGGAAAGAPNLVDIGRGLQGLGFQVGEHPAFGGVHPVHTEGSYHYQGRAIDVNWPGGGPLELGRLERIYSALKREPHVELLIEDAGRQNQHLHYAMGKGGVVRGELLGDTGAAGRRHEAVLPLESAHGRRMLADAFREALADVGGRGQSIQFGDVIVRDDHDIRKLGAELSTALAVRR